jgi:hypothetical protein
VPPRIESDSLKAIVPHWDRDLGVAMGTSTGRRVGRDNEQLRAGREVEARRTASPVRLAAAVSKS